MTHRHRSVLIFVCLTLLPLLRAGGQEAREVVGVPWTGTPGITETVEQIMARETQRKPFEWSELRETRPEPRVPRHEKRENPNAPTVSQWPALSDLSPQGDPRLNPQTVGTTFLANQASESGFVPPDVVGAVGPDQILVPSNGRIKVFDKAGVLGGLNVTTDVFFASVRTASTADPHVRYDRLSQRWFVVMIDVATPNRVLIAVSSGSHITSTLSFTFYQFQHDLVGTTPNTDTGGFADYPTLGVDANALYVGMNIFNAAGTAVIGTTVYIVRKSALLSGSLVVTPFRQIGAAGGTGAGPWTPQGVDNDDPGATEGYFIGVDAVTFGLLNVRRVSTPGGTPTLSGNLNVTVPTTYIPLNVPALGTSTFLDALDDRLFAAALHKNKITGSSSLWTAHNIRVNTSGVGGSTGTRDACRWYEIGTLTGGPSLLQSGTLFDPAATSPRYFWIPSVAMSGQGHVALGSSTAGTGLRAEIAASGRLSSDASGTTQAFTLAQSSTFAYNVAFQSPQRWGDYSQTVVDPTDDMTMWTFQEYCNATNSWGVRVIQLKAPPPATPSLAIPDTVLQGESGVNVVISGTSVSGSGFFDPGADAGGPGFPNHMSATISGTGVTVNSVTFNTPTQVTLNVSVSLSAALGGRTVTVTNPDAQGVTSASAILNVDAPFPIHALAFDSQIMSGGNGNGSVDPNECSNLSVTVRNVGNLTATGITGTLTTSTPGATVTVFSSPYANLAPGATGTNTIPFKVSTSPSYVCGTPVALTLTLTYTGGSNVATTSLPSGAGYAITSSTGASIDPGTTDIGNHGDDVVTAITLPFSYSYYGTNFTAANVTSNGNLQFSSSNPAFTNVCLPTATITDLISPHWDDQRTDLTFSGKGIFTSTSGISPNRIFNIEWRTVYFSNTAQNAHFEIRLYESQQKFDMIYGTMDQSGISATVGCQQGTGSSSTQHACNTGGLTSGLKLEFTHVTCVDAGGAGCPAPIVLGVPLNSGWNMISDPTIVTNDSVRVLYPTSTLDYAYSYSGGYVQDYTMENRKGYWETFPSAVTQNVTGLPITRDTFNVVSGWNMVGSISNPVDTNTIVSIPPGLRESPWFGFNGAYFEAAQLIPGKGYWVRTNGAGQFVLANPLLALAANVQLSGVNPADVLNTLTIADSRGRSQTLYFGVDEKKSLPVSMYVMPPMPPVGTFDARFSTADGGSMVQTHGAEASAGAEFTIAIQSDAYPLTVTWNVKNSSYALTDGQGSKVFSPKEMNGEGTFRIANSNINKISVKLTGGTQLPKEFALSQNYPNPFNPSTTIKYDLPVDTRVSVKLFNILGQEVLTLVNEEQKAGYKSVEWNASNVASGVYFYTIEAGQFRASKKLLLLR